MSEEETANTKQNEESDYDGFGAWLCEEYESGSQDVPPTPRNLFRPGMSIELNEENYRSMLCVGSITRVSGDFVLAHFDGWEDSWDVWYRFDAPEIRPIGTCKAIGCELYPPFYAPDADTWEKTGDWDSYLVAKNYVAAPIEAFSKLCISEVNEQSMIQSLFVLSANKVASIAYCYVGIWNKIGYYLDEKLRHTKVCTICGIDYLMGYKCVKAFTIRQELRSPEGRSMQTGSVCSLPCFANFKESFIGNLPQDKFTISLADQNESSIQSPFDHLMAMPSRDRTISSPQASDTPSAGNLFRIGMKIEAVDPNFPEMYCPCTVLRCVGDEVMFNFDGWGHYWDMWLYWYSPLMRPIGTTQLIKKALTIYNLSTDPFQWESYLKESNSIAAPKKAFSELYVCEFSHSDAVLPLSLLVVNSLLRIRDKTKFSRCIQLFPFVINGKPFQLKECFICKKRYFRGWLAIPAFTVPKYLRQPNWMAQLCSHSCLREYHKDNIGGYI